MKTTVVAAMVLQTAETQVNRALLEIILQQVGLEELDGVPVSDWIEARRSNELEKALLAMGDISPAAHDAVRACINDAVKHRRPGR